METLALIAKNLLLIIMIASFLELLIPDSNSRPFLRFAIGLFVILAVINPVLKAVELERPLQTEAWDMPAGGAYLGERQESGAELNRKVRSQGQTLFEDKLEKQVTALGMLVPGVTSLQSDAVVDDRRGGVEKVVLKVKLNHESAHNDGTVSVFAAQDHSIQEQEAISEKLMTLMENLYGIDRQKVTIEFEEG